MAKKTEMSGEVLLCQAGTLASAIPTTFCLGQTIQLSAQIAATKPSKASFDVAARRQSKPGSLVAAIREGLTRSLDNGVAKYMLARRGRADMRVRVAIVALGLFSCERAAAQARPSAEEQSRAIETARANALKYAKSLPDFICTEVVQLFTRGGWAGDRVTLQLSYVDGKEKYGLLTINGKPTNQPFESINGLVTEGEFGTMLFNIFAPDSAAEFQWKGWTMIDKRRAGAYSFRVARNRSHYIVGYRTGAGERTTAVGERGVIDLDAEAYVVLRLTIEAADIPNDSQISQAFTSVEYAFTDVAGEKRLLPVRAESRMSRPKQSLRNEVTFTDYRKFTADSSIEFKK